MKVRDVEFDHVSRYGFPWQKSRLTLVAGENGVGKSRALRMVAEALAETAGSRVGIDFSDVG